MDFRRAEDAEAGLEFVAASQRAELMAAHAAESDLDLAYRLQLQEAMAASLAAFPSSSSSSSSPSSAPPPPPTDPKAHASDPEDDYLSHALALQVLELERFNQERADAELREAELRRASAEMRRRVHDERFARALEAMPDDEWEDFGDNFERPFDGPLLNGQEEEEEPFRLYFKGMASTGCVRGARVQLAAVGVALCDPADNLVLKVQKPLAVGVPGTGREVLEAKALVEGLTAVISLGIKRVNVFFDCRVLYNHVTGAWRVKQRKVANTIDQVYLLQKKLERCAMFLLPRCHVKFVFKLAREAIDMQITKNVDLNGDVSLKQTCGICLEDTDPSQMSSIDGCLHQFCFSCMKQHVEVKLLHAMLPGCPHDGCNVMLNLESSKKFLSPRLYEIMSHRIKEASIPAAEKLYCPYPRCSALMSRSETIFPQQDSSSKQYGSDISGLRKCIKCNGSFCINCKVPWHDRMSCYDYKRLNPHPRAEDARLQTLAKQKLWRQCLKCNHMIELAEGCFHITCRCGYEFCYTCGAEWKNKKATCSCPLWDEGYIWYDNDEDNNSEEEFYDDEDDTYDSYDDEYDADDYLR